MIDIKKVLDLHQLWLIDQPDGERADLSRANLSGADLSRANLSGADLSGADLRWANLSYANLSYANLSGADLRWANLSYANLRWANLIDANLSGANLSGANLSGANLRGAKGIILLPVQDYRGYSWAHAIQADDGWRIRAGCRFFTIGEAREHWGPRYTGDRELGDMYLHACDWLERRLEKMPQFDAEKTKGVSDD